MLSIIYGLSLEEAKRRQDIVDYVEDFAQRATTAAMPGKSWIDIFPLLEYIPYHLNPWKIYGERSYQYDSKILMGLLNEVKARTVRVLRLQLWTGRSPRFCRPMESRPSLFVRT